MVTKDLLDKEFTRLKHLQRLSINYVYIYIYIYIKLYIVRCLLLIFLITRDNYKHTKLLNISLNILLNISNIILHARERNMFCVFSNFLNSGTY